jgi:hypothetical protein
MNEKFSFSEHCLRVTLEWKLFVLELRDLTESVRVPAARLLTSASSLPE